MDKKILQPISNKLLQDCSCLLAVLLIQVLQSMPKFVMQTIVIGVIHFCCLLMGKNAHSTMVSNGCICLILYYVGLKPFPAGDEQKCRKSMGWIPRYSECNSGIKLRNDALVIIVVILNFFQDRIFKPAYGQECPSYQKKP